MLEHAVPDRHVAEFVFEPVPFRILPTLAVRQAVTAAALFGRGVARHVHYGRTHPQGNRAILLEAIAARHFRLPNDRQAPTSNPVLRFLPAKACSEDKQVPTDI